MTEVKGMSKGGKLEEFTSLRASPLDQLKTFGDLIDLLNLLQEPFMITDKKGNILFFSSQMKELLGEIGFEEFYQGENFNDLFSSQEDISSFLSSSSSNTSPRRIITNVKIPSSEDLKELSWIVISPSDQDLFLLILSNDTLITLDSFRQNIINNLSHELRTPLTILKGILEYLLNPVTSNMSREELNEHLRIMLEKTMDLEGLIHELLEVVKWEKGQLNLKKHWFPVASLLKRLVMRYVGKAKKFNIKVTYELDLPERAELLGDAARINYMVSELLENAIKFSLEGGSISFSAKREGDNLLIKVVDEGVGIPEVQLPKIFAPFFKGDNRPNRKTYGVGLGLHLVKRIVEGHEGEIKVTSKLGVGTKVEVRLPNLRVKE